MTEEQRPLETASLEELKNKLLESANYNKVTEVNDLVNNENIGKIINGVNGSGDSALIFAAMRNNIDTLNALLKVPGIDVNIKNKNGNTALIIAASKGNAGIVKALLGVPGINVNIQNKENKNTALIIAASNGDIAIAQGLLKVPGIDVNIKNNKNNTALTIAASNWYTEIAQSLLAVKGIDVNAHREGDDTALMFAAMSGDIAIVNALLKVPGIDIKTTVNEKNNINSTALILATKSPVHAMGNKDKELAKQNQLAIVKKLLEVKNINVNANDDEGNTALISATIGGRTDIVEALLEVKYIDVNAHSEGGDTALIRATIGGRTDIVKALLNKQGIDVNIQGKNKNTALIIAASNGSTEIVKALLNKQGIGVNIQNNDGNTAAISAATNGHTEIVKALLDKQGIDVNIQNNDGNTAAISAAISADISAAISRRIDIVKALLKVPGIDVNIQNTAGNTVLEIVEFKHEQLVNKMRKDLTDNKFREYNEIKDKLEEVLKLLQNYKLEKVGLIKDFLFMEQWLTPQHKQLFILFNSILQLIINKNFPVLQIKSATILITKISKIVEILENHQFLTSLGLLNYAGIKEPNIFLTEKEFIDSYTPDKEEKKEEIEQLKQKISKAAKNKDFADYKALFYIKIFLKTVSEVYKLNKQVETHKAEVKKSSGLYNYIRDELIDSGKAFSKDMEDTTQLYTLTTVDNRGGSLSQNEFFAQIIVGIFAIVPLLLTVAFHIVGTAARSTLIPGIKVVGNLIHGTLKIVFPYMTIKVDEVNQIINILNMLSYCVKLINRRVKDMHSDEVWYDKFACKPLKPKVSRRKPPSLKKGGSSNKAKTRRNINRTTSQQ